MSFLKRISLGLAFVMCFSSVSVYAKSSSQATVKSSESYYEEDAERVTLTVEEAVEKAISYSHTLKNIEENIEQADENFDDTVTSYTTAEEGYDIIDLSTQLRSIRNQILNYQLSSEVEKLSIEISVKEYFADIINAEKQLELYQEEIDIAEAELEIAKVKMELGLLSETDYQSQVSSYNSTVRAKRNLATTIEDAYNSLNTVLGNDLKTKYNLVLDMEYSEYDGDSLTTTINKALSSSQTIIESERSYELTKYELDSFSLLTSSGTRYQREVAVSQAARSLEDTRTSVQTSVENMYNQIMSLEDSYKDNLESLKELESNLEILKVKYELGSATELEVRNAQYKVDSMQLTIENQVAEHEILVEKFSNPVLF